MSKSVEIFTNVLIKERDALSALMDQISADAINRAVELIVACKEKVVFIGVGKSGIIGRKIAATFSSLGTKATFVHASDALHGDIGIISAEDVVVLISNSGSTEEMLILLPHLKLRRVSHIAIVGNLGSQMAKEADIVIPCSVAGEADEYNLVPTCSTTVQLAVGDGLGIAVAVKKGFTPDDFAINHPAGHLGKRLTLRVGSLMHKGEENPVLTMGAIFPEVIAKLAEYQAGAINIVDNDNKLVGLITDGDLKRSLVKYSPKKWPKLLAFDIMTPDPIITHENVLAIEALRVMEDRESQISVLPVVDGKNECVGIIRIHDIVKAGL